jgi:hypothetical protein
MLGTVVLKRIEQLGVESIGPLERLGFWARFSAGMFFRHDPNGIFHRIGMQNNIYFSAIVTLCLSLARQYWHQFVLSTDHR